ncbi:uncharacterized protein LOC142564599 [Dermacentor variabilis]|uniref:uncharacterized protein LOC142564599 n=1 Tax=Dermacentor variabilis TaxID=34621 RepID=UPI003F5CA56F
MVQRTYKLPGGPNDSICVMSPFSVMMDTEQHELEKTFTYRNLSSTQTLHEDLTSNATYWPIAKFRMHFYETYARPKKVILRKKRYNFVNSSTIMSAYGYDLDPPYWQFLYSRVTCAVVNVRPKTYMYSAGPPGNRIRTKPQCELWITANLLSTAEEVKHRSKLTLCHSYFKRLCDISDVQTVFIPEHCLRTQ